jgi:glycosyltransferase involved in cell wall biosynthesis
LAKEELDRTSIFIVPRASTAWRGNEAGWITASGWAAAGQQLWGGAVVTTTDGIYAPQESMLFPRGQQNSSPGRYRRTLFRNLIPEFPITAYKDWKLFRSKPRIWPIEKTELLDSKKVMMIWERHDLFEGPGRRLADKLKVPLVISVEAAVVWEAHKWGVNRPVWGKLLEKYVEARSLKQADLVSCVSEEVKHKVVSMGVPESRVIVSPNRVDSSVFNPQVDGTLVKEKYNLQGRRVIGWTGSFRRFHGLETVIMAFKKLHDQHPDTLLMLVGDGFEFKNIQEMAIKLDLSDQIILPGKQPFTTIPAFLANFEIALVSASSADGFHYSPLKLREYLAVGKAVIAPRAGDIPILFVDGHDLLLYQAGNVEDLFNKMKALIENSDLHSSIEKNARTHFDLEGTWVHELKKVCEILKIPY